MGWYEDEIKSCDKIIVVCTKDGKRMYEEKEHTKGLCHVYLLLSYQISLSAFLFYNILFFFYF